MRYFLVLLFVLSGMNAYAQVKMYKETEFGDDVEWYQTVDDSKENKKAHGKRNIWGVVYKDKQVIPNIYNRVDYLGCQDSICYFSGTYKNKEGKKCWRTNIYDQNGNIICSIDDCLRVELIKNEINDGNLYFSYSKEIIGPECGVVDGRTGEVLFRPNKRLTIIDYYWGDHFECWESEKPLTYVIETNLQGRIIREYDKSSAKTIDVTSNTIQCGTCMGQGKVMTVIGMTDCPICGGRGKIQYFIPTTDFNNVPISTVIENNPYSVPIGGSTPVGGSTTPSRSTTNVPVSPGKTLYTCCQSTPTIGQDPGKHTCANCGMLHTRNSGHVCPIKK